MSESIKMYEFVEPHITGGDSRIVISEYNIIKYMKEHVVPQHTQVLSDKELTENFCVTFWAKPYNDLESRIKALERQLEEANKEILDLRKVIDNHSTWLHNEGSKEGAYYYSNARCDLINRIDKLKEKDDEN